MPHNCKKTYITTPIYYVNDIAHIGHAYTTIIADTISRYARLNGIDTFFLTGTDEHGQKIEEAAKIKNIPTQKYADEISSKFKSLWDDFDISYDKFIRTTDDEHKKNVQKAFETMYDNGDIYKDIYKGNYCISCESFFTETQIVDEIFCPDCGKETKLVEEESYFFKLSKYQDKLLQWYEEKEDCILPRNKKQEVISFVAGGLNDLSITRTSFSWGVHLPSKINDPKHVVYVWLDALMNYITALDLDNKAENLEYWKNTTHIIGKDILKFHAIYWPAFLLSLGYSLPRHIATHGWWTRDGEKMSKSKGNVVNPKEIADAYGLDSLRYFLMREVPFGQDGDFSQKALIGRINGDLSNGFGNLLNRIIGMSGKYFEHNIKSNNVLKYHSKEFDDAHKIIDKLPNYIYNMQLNKYLEDIWKVLQIANNAITTHEPWVKMKEGKEDEAMATVALCSNILAQVTILLNPVMPEISTKIADALNFKISASFYDEIINKKSLLKDFTIKVIPPLFEKIELPLVQESSKKESLQNEEGIITIDQFFQSSIKIGHVLKASSVEDSEKLILLSVDIGEEAPRQIVAGIKKFYSPEDLLGTQVCVLSNLKPASIMGIESQGMILAAKQRKKLILIRPEKDVKAGANIG